MNILNFKYDKNQKIYIEDGIISKFMVKVFGWMFLGLGITSLTILLISTNPLLTDLVVRQGWPVLVAMFGTLIIAFTISSSKSLERTKGMFIAFTLLQGVSLSFLPFAYDITTLSLALFITVTLFGSMATYGYVTNENLSKYGPLLRSALFGLIFINIANIFFRFPAADMTIGIMGAMVFVALIAFDVNKLKTVAAQLSSKHGEDNVDKFAVLGALHLYLNFVNLFLYILRILNSKNRKR